MNKISYYEDKEKIDRFLVIYKDDGRFYIFDCDKDRWSLGSYIIWKSLKKTDVIDYTDYYLAGAYIETQQDFKQPDGMKKEFIRGTFELKLGKRL